MRTPALSLPAAHWQRPTDVLLHRLPLRDRHADVGRRLVPATTTAARRVSATTMHGLGGAGALDRVRGDVHVTAEHGALVDHQLGGGQVPLVLGALLELDALVGA